MERWAAKFQIHKRYQQHVKIPCLVKPGEYMSCADVIASSIWTYPTLKEDPISRQEKQHLTVEQWGIRRSKDIAKISGKWAVIASQKAAKTDGLAREVFSASEVVLADIQKLATRVVEGKICDFDFALVCLDEERRWQAIALVSCVRFSRTKHERFVIQHLATHPHNIRASINSQEVGRVSGAGSAIVKELASRCQKKMQEIFVESLLQAIEFYTKLGFERTDFFPGMVLRGKALQKLQKTR